MASKFKKEFKKQIRLAIAASVGFIIAYSWRDFIVGSVKSLVGDSKGAIIDFTLAIEIDPKRPESYTNRGLEKMEIRDYTGAIKDFNRALDINPEYALTYTNRGYAKFQLNDINGACADWYKAREFGRKEVIEMINKHCK